MQGPKIKPSLFTWIRSKFSRISTKPSPAVIPSSRLFRNIDELPLDRFIICITDEDLSALIKDPADLFTGLVSVEELNNLWGEIFLDYIDLTADANTRYRLSLSREIKIKEAKLTQIEGYLFLLQTIYSEEAAALLCCERLGFEDIVLDPTEIDDYFAKLNNIKTRSRETKIDIDLMTIELDELNESDKKIDDRKADKKYFLNILARIATFKKVAVIRTSEISVAEFCAMFSEYLDYIKALSKTPSPKNG